ncbi:uncharacterized protein Dvar_28760 [Desulfosarcina variabilis str. Montpellier]|uniref:hypothetical protein n=1 Tax=Desulfosarcina variabilis TaxID=2300 RepID=UPI003AFA8E88
MCYAPCALFFVIAMAGLCILFPAAFDSAAQPPIHHALEVEILHAAQTLRGIDTIHLPKGASRLRVTFRPGVRMLAVEGATYTHEERQTEAFRFDVFRLL